MNIYKIEHDILEHDAYTAHIIVANCQEEVRSMAKAIADQEGEDIWDEVDVEYHGEYGLSATKPFILLSSYRDA